MSESTGFSLSPRYLFSRSLLTIGIFSKVSAKFSLSNVIIELGMAIKISLGHVM